MMFISEVSHCFKSTTDQQKCHIQVATKVCIQHALIPTGDSSLWIYYNDNISPNNNILCIKEWLLLPTISVVQASSLVHDKRGTELGMAI